MSRRLGDRVLKDSDHGSLGIELRLGDTRGFLCVCESEMDEMNAHDIMVSQLIVLFLYKIKI